jgi:ribosomal protein S18 acetylase RimI-like enzyme
MLLIRPYSEHDAAGLAGLVTALGYPVAADEMRRRLEEKSADYHTLVAELGGGAVGFIGLVTLSVYESSLPIGYVLALSVSPDHQRQGIGKALLVAGESHFIASGVNDVRVSSGLHREEAHRFYEAMGYARTGYRFRKALASESA